MAGANCGIPEGYNGGVKKAGGERRGAGREVIGLVVIALLLLVLIFVRAWRAGARF